MKRIVLVGGGTGGHFYPLIAVAERLKTRAVGGSLELFYIGPEPYNQSELDRLDIRFVSVPAGKWRRYFSLQNFSDLFKVAGGFFVSLYRLFILYPDVIFSKGGYTSVPVVLAGFFLRIPIVIHESDSRPGLANRIGAKFARYIAISFDEVARFFPSEKTAQTGLPIRQSFFESHSDPLGSLGLPGDKPLIFVTGGSQGAERINILILQSLDELLPNYTILHQTGNASAAAISETASGLISDSELLSRYFVRGSLDGNGMTMALSAAALVISRAGSGTIFEIAHKGKPSILVPIPESISHDQHHNAFAYARAGAASVIEEGNITDGLLAAEVNRIMSNPEKYQAMSAAAVAFAGADAAITIADTLIGIIGEHD